METPNIQTLKALRVAIDANIQESERLNVPGNPAGRELSLVRTKLQEAKMWTGQGLGRVGSTLPAEFQDKASINYFVIPEKKLPTIVNFILDKSGSMESVRQATISGFNEYINTLKNDTKSEYLFTLTLFDTQVTKSVVAESIQNVKELDLTTYAPGNGTALYDAVCGTIKDFEGKIPKDQKVITVIMTDGEENSSKEYTQVQMKKMVEDLEKAGNWTFVYLGANQDSYANAQKFGMQRGNTANYNSTTRGTMEAINMVATNTAFYASSADLNTKNFFSKKDQDDLSAAK